VYKAIKNVLHRNGKILKILIHIKLVGILYRWLFCKRKKNKNMCLSLRIMLVLRFHFVKRLFLPILRKS